MIHIIWDASKCVAGLLWRGSVGAYRYWYPSQEDVERAEILQHVRNLSTPTCNKCYKKLEKGDTCVVDDHGIRHMVCPS